MTEWMTVAKLAGGVGGWAGWLVGLGGLIVILLNAARPYREMALKREETLTTQLIQRVEKLEKDLAETRQHYEAKLEHLHAEYEAAARIARHELNNVKMRFRALVLLLKRLPDPPSMLTAILADIEAMEAEQAKAEALEKGVVSAAKIEAAAVKQTAAPDCD